MVQCQNKYEEAVSSINHYISKLDKAAKVMVSTFDDISYDVIREAVVRDWIDISPKEALPRGMTPLYDSCGKLMTKAEQDNAEKTIFVIMTDGAENNSREYTKEVIKNKIDSFKSKGWEIVFLGADFDSVTSVASSLGVGITGTLNYTTGNYQKGMDVLANATNLYVKNNEPILFSSEVQNSVSKQ